MTIRGPSGTCLVANTHQGWSFPACESDADGFKSRRAAQNPRAVGSWITGQPARGLPRPHEESGQPPKDERRRECQD